MLRNELHKFFLSIVLPSILAIGLFILSLFTLVLPTFERNIMDKKKEMISELTNTAWSLIEEFGNESRNGNLKLEEAQQIAANRIKQIRYGRENKDYFWIIDKSPTMIMHPYRDELISTNLNEYKDPSGKKLFLDAVDIVERNGQGFISYMWQWKDDSTRIVEKLSYVKGYNPWGWIVGTGIYLEDVKLEIKQLRNRLLRISLLITLIITIIISFVIRQSLTIENKRKLAEDGLKLSKQKYKSLVDASTEGTLMILNKSIIFSNLKFSDLAGYDSSEVLFLNFNELFHIDWDVVISFFDDPKRSISLETQINCKNNTRKDVIISVSKIEYAKDDGYIIITKEVTQQKQIQKETEHLSQELQTSLSMMNQPIKCFVNEMIKCSMDTSIHEATKLMTRKNRDAIFIHNENEIIGIVNNSDLKKRVIVENYDIQKSVMEIMTSPVISISANALIYEAILLLRNKQISHLGVRGEEGKITGIISSGDISVMQQNSVSHLIKEIEIAEDVETLRKIHTRVPVLVNALINSGDNTSNITRIISSVSDAINYRLIQYAIEYLGEPPCKFAFMVMGSEGRMEQTLSTDQDNAIVFENQDADKLDEAYDYFQKLGNQVCNNLNAVGYKLCRGNNMAKNPKWTQPVAIWKEYFAEWINSSDPQSIMDASIFFDFSSVYGENHLITELKTFVNETTESKSVFFYQLAHSIFKFKPPINLFGNIIGNNASGKEVSLDIKKVILPIIGFIRIYALHHHIDETNSLLRIKQLRINKLIDKSICEELVLSYNYLMKVRLRFQAKKILHNEQPDNIVDTNELTHIEIATIKKIFGEISNLQTKLNFDFKGTL